MSITEDNLLLVQLVDWLNENAQKIGLPVQMEFDGGSAASECLWLQPLSGTVKRLSYTDGGYIGELPFAVYYQLPKTRTDMLGTARLSAPLWNIAVFLEENRPPISLAQAETRAEKVQITASPNAFMRNDAVSSDQAVFKLVYSCGVRYAYR